MKHFYVFTFTSALVLHL